MNKNFSSTSLGRIVDVDRKYVVIYSYLQYLYAGKLKVDAWLALGNLSFNFFSRLFCCQTLIFNLLCVLFIITIEELLELAEEYQDLAVKKFCENQIKLGICIDNVANLFPLALNFNALVSNS